MKLEEHEGRRTLIEEACWILRIGRHFTPLGSLTQDK